MIRGVLLDLDGTVYVEGKPIEGAKETIQWLSDKKIAFRFVTNSTLKNRQQILERLKSMGFEIEEDWIFTPARCAYFWLKENKANEKVLALVIEDLKEDLEDLNLTDEQDAGVVLVGDMGEDCKVDLLNKALRCLQKGATFTALAQNRFWVAQDGSRLDVGAFVAALEYGSEKSCERIFGKPCRTFFEMALTSMGVRAEQAVMLGDDIEGDVLGAQAIGILGAQVKTGKYKHLTDTDKLKQAKAVLNSIADLPKWIQKQA